MAAQAAAKLDGVERIASIVHGAGIAGHDAAAGRGAGGAGNAAGGLQAQKVWTPGAGPGAEELYAWSSSVRQRLPT